VNIKYSGMEKPHQVIKQQPDYISTNLPAKISAFTKNR